MPGLGMLISAFEQANTFQRYVLAAFVAGSLVLGVVAAVDISTTNEREWAEYKSYMMECVPRQTEQRCHELYKWRGTAER